MGAWAPFCKPGVATVLGNSGSAVEVSLDVGAGRGSGRGQRQRATADSRVLVPRRSPARVCLPAGTVWTCQNGAPFKLRGWHSLAFARSSAGALARLWRAGRPSCTRARARYCPLVMAWLGCSPQTFPPCRATVDVPCAMAPVLPAGTMSSAEGRGTRQAAADQRSRARQEKQEKQERRLDPSKKLRQLPGALTDAGLKQAINELPVGARLAADTVYKCWCEGKFADDEFISFLQSISTYSPALLQMVRPPGAPQRGKGEDLMPAAPQHSEEAEAAMGINKEWRLRRRAEAVRRRAAGITGGEHEQCVGYLQRTFTCLRQQLPDEAQPVLLDAIMAFSRKSIGADAFGQQMQDLVDAYQLMVPLDYVPQRQYKVGESAAETGGKRGTSGMHAETCSKGSARGSKKSKAQVAPVKAISLDDTDLSRCESFLSYPSPLLPRLPHPLLHPQHTQARSLSQAPSWKHLPKRQEAVCAGDIAAVGRG
jgi:hypothetical protein